jgi:hypothetical protein
VKFRRQGPFATPAACHRPPAEGRFKLTHGQLRRDLDLHMQVEARLPDCHCGIADAKCQNAKCQTSPRRLALGILDIAYWPWAIRLLIRIICFASGTRRRMPFFAAVRRDLPDGPPASR